MPVNYEFKEIDQVGQDTLNALDKADAFNRWMYDTISPFCKGDILEIGSGIGNISVQFLKENRKLMVSDIRGSYCELLRKKFGSDSNCLGVMKIDLVHPEFDLQYQPFFQRFDTVFALNVIEHIEKDHLAIANASKFLKPGGNLVILVPSYSFLFNEFDRKLEHYRRYTLKNLVLLFVNQKLKVIHSQYFNLAGIAGWFFSGRLLKRKIIPEGQLKLFNRLVPLFKLLDALVFRRAGLSSIVVGQKSGQ